MIYEYTKDNRLNFPHKYQFSPFGPEFLKIYTESREKYVEKFGNVKDYDLPEDACPTAIDLYNCDSYEKLTAYVKKYEVWKRLFTEYDDNFRKASGNHTDPLPYALLSLACLMYCKRTIHLPFLNCALKLNDLLCSIEGSMQGSARALSAQCLQTEKEVLTKLCTDKQLTL